jgi:hypothetical protein
MQDLCILRRQFLFLAGSLLVAALPATGAGVQGGVRMLEGEAWRNDLPLKQGDVIAAGDLLRTGAASRLLVRLEGGVYFAFQQYLAAGAQRLLIGQSAFTQRSLTGCFCAGK